MLKRLFRFLLVSFTAVNLCGCVVAMGVMAESAKAKQNFDIPYSQALDVVKGALKTLDIEFERADIRQDIAQVKGKYSNGRTVRILISKVSDTESEIAVRAGMTGAGKKDAEDILKAIADYYDLTKTITK
ncbi:MAG: DUF3568 family protein [Candidatus Omnitrophica bacterium]|nr:DUF3568 family protein [Candidatus Omnitrophota bacterium]